MSQTAECIDRSEVSRAQKCCKAPRIHSYEWFSPNAGWQMGKSCSKCGTKLVEMLHCSEILRD